MLFEVETAAQCPIETPWWWCDCMWKADFVSEQNWWDIHEQGEWDHIKHKQRRWETKNLGLPDININ